MEDIVLLTLAADGSVILWSIANFTSLNKKEKSSQSFRVKQGSGKSSEWQMSVKNVEIPEDGGVAFKFGVKELPMAIDGTTTFCCGLCFSDGHREESESEPFPVSANVFLKSPKLEMYLRPDGTLKLWCDLHFNNTTVVKNTKDVIKLSADMSGWRTSPHADVTFIVEGRQIRGVSFILSQRSSVFATQLTQVWRKKADDNDNNNAIVIEGIEFTVFDALLEYVHQAKFAVPDMAFAIELLMAADRYDIQALVTKCEMYICVHISRETVVDALILADRVCSKPISKACLQILKQRKCSFRSIPGWERIYDNKSLLGFIFDAIDHRLM